MTSLIKRIIKEFNPKYDLDIIIQTEKNIVDKSIIEKVIRRSYHLGFKYALRGGTIGGLIGAGVSYFTDGNIFLGAAGGTLAGICIDELQASVRVARYCPILYINKDDNTNLTV